MEVLQSKICSVCYDSLSKDICSVFDNYFPFLVIDFHQTTFMLLVKWDFKKSNLFAFSNADKTWFPSNTSESFSFPLTGCHIWHGPDYTRPFSGGGDCRLLFGVMLQYQECTWFLWATSSQWSYTWEQINGIVWCWNKQKQFIWLCFFTGPTLQKRRKMDMETQLSIHLSEKVRHNKTMKVKHGLLQCKCLNHCFLWKSPKRTTRYLFWFISVA